MIEGSRLSPLQERVWQQQTRVAEGACRASCLIELRGRVDVPRLRMALDRIVARYEILRTAFVALPGVQLPLQVITNERCLWEERPIAALQSAEIGPSELLTYVDAVSLSLEAGQVLHALYQPTGENSAQLLITLPSLCADSLSLIKLAEALAREYVAPTGETEPLQYADLAEWQWGLLEGDESKQQSRHWTQLDLASLGTARLIFENRHHQTAYRIATVSDFMPASSTREMRTLAQELGVAPDSLWLAVWQILLADLTGQASVATAIVGDGRSHAELQSTMGLLSRHLPLAVAIRADQRVDDFVRTVDRQVTEAVRWQDYFAPGQYYSHDDLPRGLPYAFESLALPAPIAAGDVSFAVDQVWCDIEPSTLRLAMRPCGDRTRYHFVYDADCLREADAVRIAADYRTLLHSLLQSPHARLGELERFGPEDRQRFLIDINHTDCDPQPFVTVHDLIEATSRQTPDEIAVRCGDQTLTYAELLARADLLADHLMESGLGWEDFVAVCLSRTPHLIVAMLAVLKAGGAYVPLDPRQSAARVAAMLHDARPQWVLTESCLVASLSGATGCVIDLDTLDWSHHSHSRQRPTIQPDQLAYMIYTSGSTGHPKGAMLTHRGLANYVTFAAKTYDFPPGGVCPVHTPVSFDLTITSLFPPLVTGGCLQLLDEDEGVAPLTEFVNTTSSLANVKLTPSHLRAITAQLDTRKLSKKTGTLVVGGEPLRGEDLTAWKTHAPAVRIFNEYGPTETVVGSSIYQALGDETGDLSIGRPITRTQLFVLNEWLTPVSIGAIGELFIGGSGLARGYWQRPGLTAASLIPSALNGDIGRRLYRTGDLVRWNPDGNLSFVGRADSQIKLRGFRMELGEIEATLARHHQVRECAVIPRKKGDAIAGLIGFVELYATGRDTSPDGFALRTWLESQLPDYMVPERIIIRDKLPVSVHGKIDRQALGADVAGRQRSSAAYVAPRSQPEEVLAGMWKDVLGIERIGVFDNFFEMGADSIASIQVVAKAQKAGLRLTPRQIFENQTVAALATVINATPQVTAEQGPVTGPVPLTPIQQWFFRQEFAEPYHFNQALLLEMPPHGSSAVLSAALSRVLQHHDALRLRFQHQDGVWRARCVHPDDVAPSVTCVDLKKVSDIERGITAVAQQLQQGLDLANGPLFAATWLQTGRETDRLMLVAHHLVIDSVSWSFLLTDLLASVQSLSTNRPVPLLPKTTSYRMWSQRLIEQANSDAMRTEASWWKSLAARKDVASLPMDRVIGRRVAAAPDTTVTTLSAEQTRDLLNKSSQAYRTRVEELLLAALLRAITEWTGTRTAWFDLESHGRDAWGDDLDVSRTVGWFTSIYPVRLERPSNDSPAELIKSVKESLRSIPSTNGFGMLRAWSDDAETRKQLEDCPQPEILFNYHGRASAGLDEMLPVRIARESRGALQSPRNHPTHLLQIECRVIDGALQTRFGFCRNRHDHSTIEAMATAFDRALQTVIAHTLDPHAGGWTRSDFPLAALNQPTLDGLIGRHRDCEDIYPLSPTQQGILFHTVYAPGSAVYFEQVGCTLTGKLDVDAFRTAWQQLLLRHPVLRTGFEWDRLDHPLQIVSRDAEMPLIVDDWRDLDAAMLNGRIEEFLANDRARGFDLTRAPVMRVALMQLDKDRWFCLWSHHHLILDGWSVPILLREFGALYESIVRRAIPLPPVRPYRDYIAWLKRQDQSRAEQFWRQRLAGFHKSTAPTKSQTSQGLQDHVNYGAHRTALSIAVTEALVDRSRRERVSIATLMQGAWGLLLSQRCQQQDVVFGSTSSGRPTSLAHFETMVGLFVTTLPTRVIVEPDLALSAWLQNLQTLQTAVREYEYASLLEIQKWSEMPPGESLFETHQVYENYPVGEMALPGEGPALRFSDIRSFTRANYPLTFVSAHNDETISLKLLFDADVYASDDVEGMLGDLVAVLTRMADGLSVTVQEILDLLAARAEEHLSMKRAKAQEAQQRLFKSIRRERVASPPPTNPGAAP